MHFASLLSIPDKISSMKWKGGCEKGVDGEPPELIIVYYSAGADVNIHTTGHFPLSIWARLCIRPANGVCGSGCAPFVRNWGYFTIWKLAATLLCPNLQVTQRIYSAMQVSNKSAPRLNSRPRTFHFDVSDVHLFTRLDTRRSPLAGANCHHGNYRTSRQF